MQRLEAASDLPQILRGLLDLIGVDARDSNGEVRIDGSDPVAPSRYRIGAAAACALAAQGAAVAALWKLRTGRDQDVRVDMRRAVVPGLRTAYHLSQNGYPVETSLRMAYPAEDFFRTRDHRQIYILRSPSYVQSLLQMLDLLKCSYDPADMARSVSQWDAAALEDAIAQRKLVGVVCRTQEEWRAHPQGQWLAARPPVEIEKIGDSAPMPLAGGARPLSGVRVLDFAHVLAGPVTARMLAEQGADVLRITAPRQYDQLFCALDTGPGKRSATLDLELAADLAQARNLAGSADVFVQSWRPGSIDAGALSPEALARLRPGIIYVSISAYGSGGPWASRGGYDPVGQAVSGIALGEGSPEAPKLAPTGTLNDYLSAYLASAGVLGALLRRAREGGSYHVKTSLTRSSMWVQELGEVPPHLRMRGPLPGVLAGDLQTLEGAYGRMTLPSPITQFSESRAYWEHGPEPFGTSRPEWLME